MLFQRFAFLALLTMSGAAFGQVRVAHEAQGVSYASHELTFNVLADQTSDQSIQKVRSALNLSDAQIKGMQTLMTMRQQSIEQIMMSADGAHQKLEDLMTQPNPNPTELGTAVLAVRAIHDGVGAAQEKFRTDFKALLTAEQRSTLDKFKSASDQIQALQETGILENALPVPVTMPLLNGIEPGFAIGIHGPLSNNR
jgi:hypothetical protein